MMKIQNKWLIIFAMLFAMKAADATNLIVNGHRYSLSTVSGVTPNLSTLQSQAYWNNSSLATTFANSLLSNGLYGSNLAWRHTVDNSWYGGAYVNYIYINPCCGGILDGGGLNIIDADLNSYTLFTEVVPTRADTQLSLEQSARNLKSIYNLQTSSLINGLTYDCQLFDVNNICLSTGGRYSNNHGNYGNTTSALLIGAYRLNKNIRLGAWVDQNLSTNTAIGINLSNSKPLFGIFGGWAENPTGEGYEVKVSVAYGDKSLMVTRDVTGTSEPGSGTSRLNSQAISSLSSYGFRLNTKVLASPYIGIRYRRIASNEYTEAMTSDVTVPLTYNKLTQENVALMAGLKLSAKMDSQTTLFASAGIEQNLKNRGGQYSAIGVNGLTAIEFNLNPRKTRTNVSVGAYYDIDKIQRIVLSGIYREEAFSSTATTSVLATYVVGF